MVYIPITTAQKKIIGTSFPGMVQVINVKTATTEDLASAEVEITELLKQRHRLGTKENDFTVRKPKRQA